MVYGLSLILAMGVAVAAQLEARTALTLTVSHGTTARHLTDGPECTTLQLKSLVTDMPTYPPELSPYKWQTMFPTSETPYITTVTATSATYTLEAIPDVTAICQMTSLIPSSLQPQYQSFATAAESWYNVHGSDVFKSQVDCQQSWVDAGPEDGDNVIKVMIAAYCLNASSGANLTGSGNSPNGAPSSHAGLGAAVLAGLAGVMVAMLMAF